MNKLQKTIIGALVLILAKECVKAQKQYEHAIMFERKAARYWHDRYEEMRDMWFEQIQKNHKIKGDD